MLRLVCFALIFGFSSAETDAIPPIEIINSVHELEILWRSERSFISELSDYIDSTQKSLRLMKDYVQSFQEIKPSSGGSETVHHPINALLFVRHLTVGWPHLKQALEKLSQDSKTLEHLRSREQRDNLPRQADLSQSEEAVARIIGAYKLNTSLISRGILNGDNESDRQSTGRLTAWEMSRLALALLNFQLFVPAIRILEQVMKILRDAKSLDGITEQGSVQPRFLRELLTESEVMALKIKAAKHHDEVLGKILRGEIHSFGDGLNTVPFNNRLNIDTGELNRLFSKEFKRGNFNISDTEFMREQTLRLCRGLGPKDQVSGSRLICRYSTGSGGYLRLSPLKVEYLWKDPDIVLIHQFLSESQGSRILKNVSSSQLQKTEAGPSMSFKTVDFHSSVNPHSGFLKNLAAFAGTVIHLEEGNSNLAQVKNYGIGGTYGIHSDTQGFDYPSGERLATAIVYLTDVEKGGLTVFPNIGIAVKPEKNAALLFWNTKSSGDMDPLTLRSSCPVLEGNKWVLTQWIYSAPNTFAKKCSAQMEDYLRFD